MAGLGHGLAGEGGVVNLHAVGACQNPHVGRHAVAGLEEDDIAGDEVHGVQRALDALAVHATAHRRHGLVAAHLLHGLHGILGEHLRVPLEHRRRNDDDRQEDRSDDVVALLLGDLLRRGIEARSARSHRALRLHLLDRVVLEEDEQHDHRDDAGPEQDVEDAAEGHPQQLDPLIFLLRGRDLVRAVDFVICACLLLLETGLALGAPAVRRELGLQDGREFRWLECVHQGLIVLVILRRVLRGQLAVALPDLLRLDDDGAGVADAVVHLETHRHGVGRWATAPGVASSTAD
mmetsp:Transcript_88431/g.255039  ORF Transcript_88431/g.255039 Transcript_88431/m.255039 type:complete len:291 (-) Transcript_88431:36-908(-)